MYLKQCPLCPKNKRLVARIDRFWPYCSMDCWTSAQSTIKKALDKWIKEQEQLKQEQKQLKVPEKEK